jgi:excisionase family DNA binding protein
VEEETFLTVQEAARKIGVSQSAIRNATLEGRLPFERRYGRKLIRVEQLLTYQERTQPGGVKRSGRPRKAVGNAVENA